VVWGGVSKQKQNGPREESHGHHGKGLGPTQGAVVIERKNGGKKKKRGGKHTHDGGEDSGGEGRAGGKGFPARGGQPQPGEFRKTCAGGVWWTGECPKDHQGKVVQMVSEGRRKSQLS